MAFYLIYGLHWVYVAVHGLSLVAVHGPLIAAASLVAEHELQGTRTSVVKHSGSVVAVYWLSCLTACGIFSNQRLNPCPLH